ncbi:uncharacterized protein LOC128228287 [Mya arenaria]|uniref:uncharacterized protein LOC128228287 n=1 Tax=Mya arenaria TaxID=6604 RepID=UPI0022E206A2|nr:uncharacterized protein LOC128228287 [Mya arenaria]
MKTLDIISTWIRIVIFSDILKSTGCTCQWPDGLADSTWLDSEKGELLFTSDHVTGYDVTHVVTSSTFDTWDCWIYNETGDILVMRSVDAFAPFFVTFSTTYRCLQLKKITDNSYRYYELSPIQEDMENAERMYVNEASDVTNMAELCSRDLGASGSEFKVMIKSGSESAARVTCPYALLADYTFTYTSSDGSVTCRADDVGTLGMCANTEEVAVTAPSCSRYPLYASSSTSVCVDVLEVSGHTYTSLFNGGSTSTDSALFACVGLSADGLSLSVSPLYCRKNQVPTELPVANTGANIGAVLNLTATSGIEFSKFVSCPFYK